MWVYQCLDILSTVVEMACLYIISGILLKESRFHTSLCKYISPIIMFMVKENYARQGIWKEAEFHIKYSDAAVELNENGMSGMQAQTPITEQMVEDISAIDGVEKVEELKSFGVSFDFPQQDEYDNDDYIYPMNKEETTEIEKYIEELLIMTN